MKPEYLAEIERFRRMDDDFMSKCLENAPECIKLMLRIIIGKKDLKVVKSQTEYPIKSLQGRGVRFDVFARDSEGKEYDIELQRADKDAEPRRARYNSALMDANVLKSGDDFGKLRDTYIIFITENDVMKRGKDEYSYQRREDDTGECLGDGTHIIHVNGACGGITISGGTVLARCPRRAVCVATTPRRRMAGVRNAPQKLASEGTFGVSRTRRCTGEAPLRREPC